MSIRIRNLVLGENLPPLLRTGFETGKCMPEWIWVAEREGRAVASLVASPAHIVAILLRLVATPEAEPFDVRKLLSFAASEIKARGYLGYLVWADPTRDTEKSLIAIVMAAGGVQLSNSQVACAGRL